MNSRCIPIFETKWEKNVLKIIKYSNNKTNQTNLQYRKYSLSYLHVKALYTELCRTPFVETTQSWNVYFNNRQTKTLFDRTRRNTNLPTFNAKTFFFVPLSRRHCLRQLFVFYKADYEIWTAGLVPTRKKVSIALETNTFPAKVILLTSISRFQG